MCDVPEYDTRFLCLTTYFLCYQKHASRSYVIWVQGQRRRIFWWAHGTMWKNQCFLLRLSLEDVHCCRVQRQRHRGLHCRRKYRMWSLNWGRQCLKLCFWLRSDTSKPRNWTGNESSAHVLLYSPKLNFKVLKRVWRVFLTRRTSVIESIIAKHSSTKTMLKRRESQESKNSAVAF